MPTFSRWMDSVSVFLGKIAALLVVLTVAIGFYNVVARYAGRFLGVKLTTNMLIELQWYLFSLIFLFGFPYILKIGENVRVDFLYANWSMKTKAWVNLIGHIFLLIFCIIGIWVTFYPVLQSWGLLPNGTFGQWEISPDPDGLPRAPIKTMMPVGFALLFLQGLSEIFKNIARLRGAELPFEGN